MGQNITSVRLKTASTSTAFVTEPTTAIDAVNYQITDSDKRVLDRDVVPTVYYSGAVVASTTYSVNYLTGVITFNTAPGADNVTVSGNFKPLSVNMEVKSMTLNLSNTLVDSSTISADLNTLRHPTTQQVTIDVEAFDNADNRFFAIANQGQAIFVECIISPIETFRGWFLLDASNADGSFEDVQMESFTMHAHEHNNVSFDWSFS